MKMVNWLLSQILGRAAPIADHAPEGIGPRSPRWPACRRAWLVQHPTCAACGSREMVQVHHKAPFHLFPQRELDPTNLITLCERPGVDHHLNIGHLGDWRKFNPRVEEDAARLLEGGPA